MPDRSYVGIDSTENHEWIVAVWTGRKITLSPPFRNTPAQLAALVCFITEHCPRPKICLKPASPAVLKLIKFIGGIPDVEVVLMSEAGLRMHRGWLTNTAGNTSVPGHEGRAILLACCAERMI